LFFGEQRALKGAWGNAKVSQNDGIMRLGRERRNPK